MDVIRNILNTYTFNNDEIIKWPWENLKFKKLNFEEINNTLKKENVILERIEKSNIYKTKEKIITRDEEISINIEKITNVVENKNKKNNEKSYLKEKENNSKNIKLEFKKFKENLLNELIWQQEIWHLISKSLFSYVFLSKRERPYNLFFYWPPWTWKTYSSEKIIDVINKFLPKQEKFWYKIINCNELQNEVWISKLIWTTKWYAWYWEWIDFLEFLSKWKNKVIIFDEIEKAHSNVIKLLLNIMENWRIESQDDKYFITMKNSDLEIENEKWKKINKLNNLIIIFTSNIIRNYTELYD